MAKREPQRREHVIEPSSGGATCATCHGPIADGELRFTEAFVSDDGKWARGHRTARTPRTRDFEMDDDRSRGYDSLSPDLATRFHHLACAAQHQPYKLRSALATSPLEGKPRAELEQAIERALSAVDAAEENAATRDEYQRLLAHVRDSHDDDAVLVFGDWLQSVADPRGELVAVQHKLETATGEERARLHELEKKLLATNRKQFVPERLEYHVVWRRGFVHRLEIKGPLDLASLGRAFAHPSFRILRELSIASPKWALVIGAGVPASLRVLELGPGELGPIGTTVKALPQLATLRLRGTAELAGLTHPGLVELELDHADATRGERFDGLDKRHLPKVERLVLRVASGLDLLVAALVESKLYKQIRTLALHGDLTRAGVTSLTKSKHKLDVLDVRGCAGVGEADLERVQAIAASVVREETRAKTAPPAPKQVGEWLVRHTRKPEWGIGRVVAELDEGLEVEFEHGGKKQIRNPELLEEIES